MFANNLAMEYLGMLATHLSSDFHVFSLSQESVYPTEPSAREITSTVPVKIMTMPLTTKQSLGREKMLKNMTICPLRKLRRG